MDSILGYGSGIAEFLEELFRGVPRWQIIFGSFFCTSAFLWTRRFFRETNDVKAFLKKKIFRWLIKFPPIQKKIDREFEELYTAIEEELIREEEKNLKKFHRIPEKGVPSEQVQKMAAEALSLGRYEWKNGKVSGGMFAGSDDSFTKFMLEVFHITSWSNPMHADLFPGINKMEAEIVRMTAGIFHGNENVVGTVTSGGTESLVLMMKAYRNWGFHTRGIKKPELIVPHTAHPAMDKGAELLGFTRIRKVRVDPMSMKFKLSDISKNINSNTVLIVVSAPDCAYGCIDDAASVGALAKEKGIPLHVDACLGGFILPFMDKAGFPIPPFDFRVPGVTSISADTHKYGKAPKGTSVLLYRSKEFLHHQYFSVPDWPGGIYASPTIPGSRPGCNVAMCWGAMLLNGMDGYVETTRKIITIARYLKKEFSSIPGIFVYGDPQGPIVSIGSKEFNIYLLADAIAAKGWHLQPIQNPLGIHIYLTPLHTREGVAEKLAEVVRTGVDDVRSGSKDASKGLARLYGMANALPDKSFIGEVSRIYFDVYYSTKV